MTFTLACVSSALYSAASQILSLDRTVGGRLFSGSVRFFLMRFMRLCLVVSLVVCTGTDLIWLFHMAVTSLLLTCSFSLDVCSLEELLVEHWYDIMVMFALFALWSTVEIRNVTTSMFASIPCPITMWFLLSCDVAGQLGLGSSWAE